MLHHPHGSGAMLGAGALNQQQLPTSSPLPPQPQPPQQCTAADLFFVLLQMEAQYQHEMSQLTDSLWIESDTREGLTLSSSTAQSTHVTGPAALLESEQQQTQALESQLWDMMRRCGLLNANGVDSPSLYFGPDNNQQQQPFQNNASNSNITDSALFDHCSLNYVMRAAVGDAMLAEAKAKGEGDVRYRQHMKTQAQTNARHPQQQHSYPPPLQQQQQQQRQGWGAPSPGMAAAPSPGMAAAPSHSYRALDERPLPRPTGPRQPSGNGLMTSHAVAVMPAGRVNTVSSTCAVGGFQPAAAFGGGGGGGADPFGLR